MRTTVISLFWIFFIALSVSSYGQRVDENIMLGESIAPELFEKILRDELDFVENEISAKQEFEITAEKANNTYSFIIKSNLVNFVVMLCDPTDKGYSVLILAYLYEKDSFLPIAKINEYNATHRWGYAIKREGKAENQSEVILNNDIFFDGLTVKGVRNFLRYFIGAAAGFEEELLGKKKIKFGLDDEDSDRYSGKEVESEYLFYEDFADNSNNWSTGYVAGQYYNKIESGYYYKESLNDMHYLDSKAVNLDESKDYEIETKIKIINGDEPHDLLWGKNNTDFYSFFITSSGSYKVSVYSGGEWSDLISWAICPAIKGVGEDNILRIRKVKNDFYFYINNQRVNSIPVKRFFGGEIGIGVSSNSIIHVDYLKVKYL